MASSRFTPLAKVLARSSRWSCRAASSRQRVALGVPGEGAGGREPAGRLGHDVVVGRGAAAPEGREVLLVPPDLAQRVGFSSKRSADPGQSSRSRRTQTQLVSRTPSSMPLVQCTPDRNGLAATRTGAARSTTSAYRLVAGQPPGGREHGQVVVPRELPDRLDVAGLVLVAVVDPEREPVLRRPPPGHRVEEPVRVRRCRAAAVPSSSQSPASEPVRGGDHGGPGLGRHPAAHARAERGREQAAVAQPPRAPGGSAGRTWRRAQAYDVPGRLPATAISAVDI